MNFGQVYWDKRDTIIKKFICLSQWKYQSLVETSQMEVYKKKRFEWYRNDLPLHLALDLDQNEINTELVLKLIHQHVPLHKDLNGQTELHLAVLRFWHVDIILAILDIDAHSSTVPDINGLTPLNHATIVQSNEMVIHALALPIAKHAIEKGDELKSIKNWNGIIRLYKNKMKEQFTGISSFDLHKAEKWKDENVEQYSERLHQVYKNYIRDFGFVGIPIIDEQPLRKIEQGTGLPLSVHVDAHGGPLCYQWYCDQVLIPGATSATRHIADSSKRRHDGIYHCVVSNWCGSITTSTCSIEIDDKFIKIDACSEYKIPSDTLRPNETCCDIYGNKGGIVRSKFDCQCIILPNSFVLRDWSNNDVSNSVGLQVALFVANPQDYAPLAAKEKYVAPIVQMRPCLDKVVFSPKVRIRIPHSAVSHAIMFQILPVKLVYDKEQSKFLWKSISSENYSIGKGFIDIYLEKLCTVSVLEKTMRLDDLCKRRESGMLILYSAPHVKSTQSHASFELSLVPHRRDAVEQSHVRSALKPLWYHPITTYDNFDCCINLKNGDSKPIKLRMHDKNRASFIVPTYHNDSRKHGIGYLYDVARIQVEGPNEQLEENNECISISILVPFLYPELKAPKKSASVVERHSRWMKLQIDKQEWISSELQPYSPLYHIIQIAPFSQSFWDRYENIWWFRSGDSPIVQKLFRTAYQGNQPFTDISSSTYAASIRIAVANVDHVSPYSEPIILHPLSNEQIQQFNLEAENDKLVILGFENFQEPINRSLEYHDKVQTGTTAIREYFGNKSDELLAMFNIPESSLERRRMHGQHNLHTPMFLIDILLQGMNTLDDTSKKAVLERSACKLQALSFHSLYRLIPVMTREYKQFQPYILRIIVLIQNAIRNAQAYIVPGWLKSFLLKLPIAMPYPSIIVELQELIESFPLNEDFKNVFQMHYEQIINAQILLEAPGMDHDESTRLYMHRVLQAGPMLKKEEFIRHELEISWCCDIESEISTDTSKYAFDIIILGDKVEGQIDHVTPAHDSSVVDREARVVVVFKDRVIRVEDMNGVLTIRNSKNDRLIKAEYTVETIKGQIVVTATPNKQFDLRSNYECQVHGNALSSTLGSLCSVYNFEFSTGRR